MAKTKEQQQKRLLEYQEFDLIKFKITKEGVDVVHHESGTDAGEITKKGEVQPHPDLENAVAELKLYMATRLGLLQGWDFSRERLKTNPNYLKLAKDGHDETIKRTNPNGLTFVGEGETRGVLITGSITVPNGGSTGLAVPKITFGKTVLGYEEEVEEICETIKKEIYAYRFQQKKAQLDIETEAKKKEQPDLFKMPESNNGEFDKNGERDFIPGTDQLKGMEVNSEEVKND